MSNEWVSSSVLHYESHRENRPRRRAHSNFPARPPDGYTLRTHKHTHTHTHMLVVYPSFIPNPPDRDFRPSRDRRKICASMFGGLCRVGAVVRPTEGRKGAVGSAAAAFCTRVNHRVLFAYTSFYAPPSPCIIIICVHSGDGCASNDNALRAADASETRDMSSGSPSIVLARLQWREPAWPRVVES